MCNGVVEHLLSGFQSHCSRVFPRRFALARVLIGSKRETEDSAVVDSRFNSQNKFVYEQPRKTCALHNRWCGHWYSELVGLQAAS